MCRMPFTRTPRKFLSSWVSAKRPLGAPDYTYGRGVEKALQFVGLTAKNGPNYFAGIVHDRLRWRALIDSTDLAKQKRIDKRNAKTQAKRGAKKEQAKSGILGINPWHLTPTEYETHYDKVCIELKRDAFLISGWRDKWQLPIDFDPKVDSRRVKISTPERPATPARSAPAGFSALSPPRLNRNFNSLQYLQRK